MRWVLTSRRLIERGWKMSKISEAEIRRRLKLLAEIEPSAEAADRAIEQVRQTLVGKHEKKRTQRTRIWRIILESRMTKLAAAAVIVVAMLIGIHQLSGQMESVAWADVTERFQSVPFCSAAIYIKESALAEPRQLELWMGQGGYMRMRIGTQVVFGRRGEVIKAFDLRTTQQVSADPQALQMLEILGPAEELSLETVLRGICGGKLTDVTPLINSEAVISEDLLVFDAQSSVGLEWLRIWALRESKLPVQIRMWDTYSGGCVDALISYSKAQSDVFFDADAFFKKLKDGTHYSEAGMAYMFLKDPGRQRIVP